VRALICTQLGRRPDEGSHSRFFNGIILT